METLQSINFRLDEIKIELENFVEIYKEYGIYILLDNYYGETGIETEELSTLII